MQQIDNLPLNYLFIQSKIPSKKLMIILHGRGDSARGLTFLPEYLDIDSMNYILLNAPTSYYGGFSWYDLPPNQLEGIIHSRNLLTQTLDILFEEKFNAKESFLFGFSQGSLLTFEFGARYKKELAGYIAISGYIYDASTLVEQMNPLLKNDKWLCTHGIEDEVLPYEASKSDIDMLQENGFDITFESYPKAHTMIDEELTMIVQWIKSRL